MRITKIQVLGKHLCLVCIETDEGISGVGSTAAHSGAVRALINEGPGNLSEILIGEDPTDTQRLWRKMFEQWQAQRGRGDEGGIGVNAMSALDLALWDLTGKARGLPIHRLLGGAVQIEIMIYASATAFDIERLETEGVLEHKPTAELQQECRQYLEQGFKAIKFGWGNRFAPDNLEALSAIRETIGSEVLLMIDFGCPAYLTDGWSAKDAIRVARILEDYDIFFLEEALRPADVEGFAELTRSVEVKIATGESLTRTAEFAELIDRRAVDVVQPDAQQMGITQMSRVAHRSEEAGLLCIPHCPWSAIAVAAHLNILVTVSNGILIEYPAFASCPADSLEYAMIDATHYRIIEHPLQVQDGFLQLTESPGLGLGDLVPEAVEQIESLYETRRPS